MSETHTISLKRTSTLLAALLFMAMLTVANFSAWFSAKAGAAQLTSRSLTLSSTLAGDVGTTTPAGSETNGAAAVHTFTFDKSDTAVLGIQLQYCTDPLSDPCVQPTGIDASAAVITSTALGAISASGTNNAFNRGFSFASNTAEEDIDIVLTGVVNPTVVGTFFVRIATYSAAGTPFLVGNLVDEGNVASAITEGIYITARVKETLGFSTTGAVAVGGGNGIVAPDATCEPLTGLGVITLGDPTENVLDLTNVYDNYSAFRVYTNALSGISITYEGETLESSGGNDINPRGATAGAIAPGNEWFGLAVDGTVGGQDNVAINSMTALGDFTNANIAADWGADPGELEIGAQYAGGGTYAFVAGTPTPIASSTGYVNCTTVPVKYAAAIEPLTAPGVYTTTVVYTAVPTY